MKDASCTRYGPATHLCQHVQTRTQVAHTCIQRKRGAPCLTAAVAQINVPFAAMRTCSTPYGRTDLIKALGQHAFIELDGSDRYSLDLTAKEGHLVDGRAVVGSLPDNNMVMVMAHISTYPVPVFKQRSKAAEMNSGRACVIWRTHAQTHLQPSCARHVSGCAPECNSRSYGRESSSRPTARLLVLPVGLPALRAGRLSSEVSEQFNGCPVRVLCSSPKAESELRAAWFNCSRRARVASTIGRVPTRAALVRTHAAVLIGAATDALAVGGTTSPSTMSPLKTSIAAAASAAWVGVEGGTSSEAGIALEKSKRATTRFRGLPKPRALLLPIRCIRARQGLLRYCASSGGDVRFRGTPRRSYRYRRGRSCPIMHSTYDSITDTVFSRCRDE